MTEYSSKQFMGGGVLKMQEFLSSGVFIAPQTGVYLITGTAGGGSGAVANTSTNANWTVCGGAGGRYVVKRPVELIKGQSVNVTIGAGGAAVTINDGQQAANGSAGGNTTFGSLLTLFGGSGGQASAVTNAVASVGGTPGFAENNNNQTLTILFGALSAIATGNSGAVASQRWGVSGAGLFGNAVNSLSAAANSGAGGGARLGTTYPLSSGVGGSGRLIVEWIE